MAKTASLTITGTLGPDHDVTSLALSDVKSVNFQIANNTIEVFYGDKGQFSTFDYDATATVTYTISGDSATIVIS